MIDRRFVGRYARRLLVVIVDESSGERVGKDSLNTNSLGWGVIVGPLFDNIDESRFAKLERLQSMLRYSYRQVRVATILRVAYR
jgi:hypothetical protein